jgi:hypothetical protein
MSSIFYLLIVNFLPFFLIIYSLFKSHQNDRIHQQALNNRMRTREQMERQSNQFPEFHLNDFAKIPIPKVDRSRVGAKWLIVKICRVVKPNTFHVQTKWGEIDRMIHAIHLYATAADFRTQEIRTSPILPLIKCFRNAGGWSQNNHILSCSCKASCDQRCGCVRAKRPCTIFCHPDSMCNVTKRLSSVELISEAGDDDASEEDDADTDPRISSSRSVSADESSEAADEPDRSSNSSSGNDSADEFLRDLEPNPLSDDQSDLSSPEADAHQSLTEGYCVLGAQCTQPDNLITDRCTGCRVFLHGFCASPPINESDEPAYCPSCAKKGNPVNRLAQSRQARVRSNLARIPTPSEIHTRREESMQSTRKSPPIVAPTSRTPIRNRTRSAAKPPAKAPKPPARATNRTAKKTPKKKQRRN